MKVTEKQIEVWLKRSAIAPCDYSRRLARAVLERDALAREAAKQTEAQS